MDRENVSATLTFAVPATRVFTVLADPVTHAAIDGTGWVQEAADREVIVPGRSPAANSGPKRRPPGSSRCRSTCSATSVSSGLPDS